MDECIVLVTINYRLGALGFLTTNDGVIPGNLGLKDALLALKWTRENIEYFRGDRDLITINGISAGAASVSHFIASPAAKGLFHRAIAQSGSSLEQWAVMKEPRENAFRLGGYLNCEGKSSQELLECLNSAKANDITLEQSKIMDWHYGQVHFGPVVEPEDANEPFQTENPYLRFKRGDVNRVPLITGNVKDEGLGFMGGPVVRDDVARNELSKFWKSIFPNFYQFDFLNVSDTVRIGIAENIRQFYLNGQNVGPETAEGFVNSVSDRTFNYGSYEEAIIYSNYSSVYHYVMTFAGDFSFATHSLGLNYTAVSHGDDAQYLFDLPIIREPKARALEFSQRLVKLWVSFMKAGKPELVWENVTSWEPFEASEPRSLRLDLPAELVTNYWNDRMQFWEDQQLRKLQFPQEV